MMQQSGGSQPSPQQFLGTYAAGVEESIRKLQAQRRPAPGDIALKGAESMTTADALRGKV
jgi:hypothetical protein